jgi:hypothetical protein
VVDHLLRFSRKLRELALRSFSTLWRSRKLPALLPFTVLALFASFVSAARRLAFPSGYRIPISPPIVQNRMLAACCANLLPAVEQSQQPFATRIAEV